MTERRPNAQRERNFTHILHILHAPADSQRRRKENSDRAPHDKDQKCQKNAERGTAPRRELQTDKKHARTFDENAIRPQNRIATPHLRRKDTFETQKVNGAETGAKETRVRAG